ncbi:MAG: lipid A biosynthesis acyltransferase [Bacteroidetes bacterium]|nr:MAG: lipid A biosynthesis acyltransferase [Bacteroidota bacterium]PTM10483.1 MAG: lipid A biosynthesis acyltransferase [Bacteroidota bacterium]
MTRILYYTLLWPLSLLPLSVLYVFSTGLFYLLYHGVGYRRKVVMGNLERSFPDKSATELLALEQGFYRHLCDLMVESIRMFSMGEAELRRRAVVTNPEFILDLEARQQSAILVAGHYNSWEMMGTAFPMFTALPVWALYSPIKNAFLSKIMASSRGKVGLQMLPKTAARQMFEEHNDRPTVYLFGGDQSPSSSKRSFWMEFLNQDTAVAFGAEKYAREYNCAVIFGEIRKVKRGYYTMTFLPVTYDSGAEAEGEITRKHTQILERLILEDPQYWLWTHRRWKRKREDTN